MTGPVGQIHTLRITLAHRRPIIDATEWDLLELAHKPERLDAFLKTLAEDDDLIWALLGQIEGRTPEDLMAVADGTTHEEASAALLEAIADFFPARFWRTTDTSLIFRRLTAAGIVVAKSASHSLAKTG